MSDATVALREATREIRESLRTLRESVVLRVQRRNEAQDIVTRLERLVSGMEEQATQAEANGQPNLARELRSEIQTRNEELGRARQLLMQAEAEAEIAKTNLPEQEAMLLRQANDLQAQLARLLAAQAERNAPGSDFGTDALWERANAKISDLQREASARGEVASVSTVAGSPSSGSQTAGNEEPNAETMLAALESRLGMAAQTSETSSASQPSQNPLNPSSAAESGGSPIPSARFIEFDPVPNVLLNRPVPVTAANVTQTETRPEGTETAPNPSDAVQEAVTSPSSSVSEDTNDAVVTPIADTEISAPPNAEADDDPEPKIENPTFDFRPVFRGDIPRMEPTPRVRIAAIGTGNIFRGAHLPAYPDIPQAQLVAICDPDKKAQDMAYKKYQDLVEGKIKTARDKDDIAEIERLESDLETVQLCDDISEVIELVKPDLCDICTQPFLHTPLAIQALEAGFHVMCEKPISRSWLESQRLIETVKRTGKYYQHNENWLFDPDYYTVKKLVDSGAIGELVMMYLTQAHGGPEGSPKFWNSDFGGGGSLLDNGIHAIGAAWFVAGLDKTPTVVKAAEPFGMSIRMPDRIIDGKFQRITVDDDAHILIRFEDKNTGGWSTAHVEGSWSEQDSPDTVYLGSTGRIEMRDVEGKRFAVVVNATGQEIRRVRCSGSNWQHWPSSFYGEIQNMVRCVLSGQPSIMTAEFGADCSAIVGAAYLSQKSGKKAVSLDEFKSFATDLAGRYPNDPTGADNALVDTLLAAVRK